MTFSVLPNFSKCWEKPTKLTSYSTHRFEKRTTIIVWQHHLTCRFQVEKKRIRSNRMIVSKGMKICPAWAIKTTGLWGKGQKVYRWKNCWTRTWKELVLKISTINQSLINSDTMPWIHLQTLSQLHQLSHQCPPSGPGPNPGSPVAFCHCASLASWSQFCLSSRTLTLLKSSRQLFYRMPLDLDLSDILSLERGGAFLQGYRVVTLCPPIRRHMILKFSAQIYLLSTSGQGFENLWNSGFWWSATLGQQNWGKGRESACLISSLRRSEDTLWETLSFYPQNTRTSQVSTLHLYKIV